MTVLAWLQRHFWVPMLAALIGGYLVPGLGERLQASFAPAIFIILTLVFAKIDLVDVIGHIKQWGVMAYVLLVQQIVLPLIIFAAIRPFAPELAAGVALLVAVPAAAASPVFTDLVKGNVSLCVSLYVVAYLIAPLTITLVTWLTIGQTANLLMLFRMVTLLIFGPMLVAQIGKRLLPKLVATYQGHFGSINLLIVTYLIFAIVSAQAMQFREGTSYILEVIAWLYGLFVLLHIIGYMLLWWRPVEDRLAISVSTAYMNTALAVVIAYRFFSPEVILIAVASEVPWSTVLGPVAWAHRKWVKRQDDA